MLMPSGIAYSLDGAKLIGVIRFTIGSISRFMGTGSNFCFDQFSRSVGLEREKVDWIYIFYYVIKFTLTPLIQL